MLTQSQGGDGVPSRRGRLVDELYQPRSSIYFILFIIYFFGWFGQPGSWRID
jgi:hypothetical protein